MFLLWRRGDERITVLTATAILALPNILPFPALLGQSYPLLHLPLWIYFAFGPALAFVNISSLPDGRILFGRRAWLALVLLIWETVRYPVLFINATPEVIRYRPITLLVSIIILSVAYISVVQRYRRYATPTQRQQFKLIFFSLYPYGIALISVMPLRIVTQALFGASDATLIGGLLATFIVAAASLFHQAAIILSIFRYGLWDVDLTLNRSVVAALVSLGVLLLFLIGFAVMQGVLQAFVGTDQSQAASVIAAVIAGAAFNPIRRRARNIVDRRVYKLRFDLDQLERGHVLPPLLNRGLYTGHVVAGYELLEVLGRGGMGEVYKAQNADHHVVAIKLLHAEQAMDHDSKQRFEREGMVNLIHPHIVRIYNYGEMDGLRYVIMEYIAGPTL
ncbi:protein kinase [bacterium]|nr:protein kinase [bacterium]